MSHGETAESVALTAFSQVTAAFPGVSDGAPDRVRVHDVVDACPET